jgi:hypothetical protein
MDRQQILVELIAERDRLNKAIDVLQGIKRHKGGDWSRESTRKPMSKEARDRISAAQRKRWAKVNAEKPEGKKSRKARKAATIEQ